MTPRILIIIDAFTYGGAQKVLLTLIPEWVKAGCDIEVVLIQDNPREMSSESVENLGVRFHRISARNMFDIRAIVLLLKLANRFNPSQIQAHLYWAQIWGVLVKLIVSSSKLFWVEHNTYFNRSNSQWWVFRIFARFTHQIISVSHEVQQYLQVQKVRSGLVILNPISHNFTYQPQVERSNTFVFLGRLNEQKNPKLAISAFDFAKANNLIGGDATLVIGGEGPLLESLKNYVFGLKSKNSITFVGQLTELQTVKLLQSSLCLVSTSRFEGFSLVRLEALATGAMVISTRTGGIKGILTVSPYSSHPVDGVILTESEVVEIAHAMTSVFDPIYWSENSVEKRVKNAQQHNPRKIANAYLVSFNKTDLNDVLG